MKFDVILTNPPFQDTTRRKKTPHKLWIDFTLAVFDRLLAGGGSLIQVSPSSFSSPSNIVLELMTKNQTVVLRLGTEKHFPGVGSSFSDYWIVKNEDDRRPTCVMVPNGRFQVQLGSEIQYLPNDFNQTSISIHTKVMFTERQRLDVRWDYVTAHNIRRHGQTPTLVEYKSEAHPHPVFHTNRQIWWSSAKQSWSTQPKVMWTRSGYTRPFYDAGVLGGTDMVYYVPVDHEAEGRRLEAYLNSTLMQYIFRTAKWSGFGNERVFSLIPAPPSDSEISDDVIHSYFGLDEEEQAYVFRTLGPRSRAS